MRQLGEVWLHGCRHACTEGSRSVHLICRGSCRCLVKYTYAAGAWVKYTHEPQVLSVPGKGLREGGDWSGKWEVGRWGLEWEVGRRGLEWEVGRWGLEWEVGSGKVGTGVGSGPARGGLQNNIQARCNHMVTQMQSYGHAASDGHISVIRWSHNYNHMVTHLYSEWSQL